MSLLLKKRAFALPLVAFGLFAAPAAATVVGGAITGGNALANGGTFIDLSGTGPFSIGENDFNDYNLYAFNEDQNILITSEIDVNTGINPVAGDIVASHYVAYDSPSSGSNQQIGYVDFDAPIYGIASETAFLLASDFLANTNVTYKNPTLRGLEAGDSAIIDPTNPYRLLVDWRSSNPGDYVRVFTKESPLAAVPLPASGLLLLAAFGALTRFARKGRS